MLALAAARRNPWDARGDECLASFGLGSRFMSQARLAAAPRSNARQKAGHQTGTPEFSRTSPRRASNTPWPAGAPTTIHALDLNPTTAAIAKPVITIDSKSTV